MKRFGAWGVLVWLCGGIGGGCGSLESVESDGPLASVRVSIESTAPYVGDPSTLRYAILWVRRHPFSSYAEGPFSVAQAVELRAGADGVFEVTISEPPPDRAMIDYGDWTPAAGVQWPASGRAAVGAIIAFEDRNGDHLPHMLTALADEAPEPVHGISRELVRYFEGEAPVLPLDVDTDEAGEAGETVGSAAPSAVPGNSAPPAALEPVEQRLGFGVLGTTSCELIRHQYWACPPVDAIVNATQHPIRALPPDALVRLKLDDRDWLDNVVCQIPAEELTGKPELGELECIDAGRSYRTPLFCGSEVVALQGKAHEEWPCNVMLNADDPVLQDTATLWRQAVPGGEGFVFAAGYLNWYVPGENQLYRVSTEPALQQSPAIATHEALVKPGELIAHKDTVLFYSKGGDALARCWPDGEICQLAYRPPKDQTGGDAINGLAVSPDDYAYFGHEAGIVRVQLPTSKVAGFAAATTTTTLIVPGARPDGPFTVDSTYITWKDEKGSILSATVEPPHTTRQIAEYPPTKVRYHGFVRDQIIVSAFDQTGTDGGEIFGLPVTAESPKDSLVQIATDQSFPIAPELFSDGIIWFNADSGELIWGREDGSERQLLYRSDYRGAARVAVTPDYVFWLERVTGAIWRAPRPASFGSGQPSRE